MFEFWSRTNWDRLAGCPGILHELLVGEPRRESSTSLLFPLNHPSSSHPSSSRLSLTELFLLPYWWHDRAGYRGFLKGHWRCRSAISLSDGNDASYNSELKEGIVRSLCFELKSILKKKFNWKESSSEFGPKSSLPYTAKDATPAIFFLLFWRKPG